MYPRTRTKNLHFLNFDPEIERIAQRNKCEAGLRRAEMGDRNAQLGHMGLPLVANQNQGELPPTAIPVQEGLPHVGDERLYGITRCLDSSRTCLLFAGQQLRQIPLR